MRRGCAEPPAHPAVYARPPSWASLERVKADEPALILVNLGTPKSPKTKDVRRYLREFLMDPRVVELPRLLWRPILEGIILRVRPRASAAKYATVWMPQGSPLGHYTKRQADLLQAELGVRVVPAMRYGEPALGDVLDELSARGAGRIAVLPAYPQYSATTVASVNDAVADWLKSRRAHPRIRLAGSFPTAPAYVDALEEAVRAHWGRVGRPDFAAGDRLVCSFHSIPVAMHEAGDPYRSECLQTAAALRERLGLAEEECVTTFQSVFGPSKWLGPATIDTIEALGAARTRRLDVICPGFVADCLETLEEIDQLNREVFINAGGGEFHYIRWGNESPQAIRALGEQARLLLSAW